MANGVPRPLVFVSYSHKDEVWKDRLLPHLQMLEQLGQLTPWDDRKIKPGQDWYEDIEDKLERAKVAVLLISAHFLASEFCTTKEVPVLLERRRKDGLLVVPILIHHCLWHKVHWLRPIQMLPRDGKTMSKNFRTNWHEPFTEAAGEIYEFLERGVKEAFVLDKADKPEPDAIDLRRLPMTGYELLGRENELKLLDEAFDGNTLNVVALTAWGGVGKSTLVNKWCEYLAADNFRGAERVFAWSFYSQGMRDQVASADAFIDEALRFFEDDDPSKGSPWAKGERLAELVGKQKALLLLDGMEPLQDPYQGIKDPALARLVECLAVENAGLCVITTREKVKELDDFPGHAIEQDLEQISPEAGRALLRVKRVRGSDAALEQASRNFGNHALAINLLASYLQFYDNRHISQAASIPDLPDLEDPHHRHPRRVMAAFADRFGDSPALDVLDMIGLFDRPADGGCITALRDEPAIPGLTDKLFELDEIGWQNLLDQLRSFGLLAPRNTHQKDELDAHPLVREHFGARLRAEREDAWKAGHERLYEHLKTVPEKHQPDTLAEMAPLFQAVHHGCQAGRRQEALDEVYRDRIVRKGEAYLVNKLGAFGADLGLVAAFFDLAFAHPADDLNEYNRAWLIGQAAFRLRALGRLSEAIAPLRATVELMVDQENWEQAAIATSNLSELQLTLGEVAAAVTTGEASVEHADRSGDALWRMGFRTTLADARHQAGDMAAAQELFEEAEAIQAERQPEYPLLYSAQGYRYCDLLLTLGQAEAVRERARETLEIARRHNWLLDIALDH